MGNKPSTTFRSIQPSLSHSFNYNRLSSSYSSASKQPLLANNQDEIVEQLKSEIEANRRRNESLERRNETLEKDMRELRAAIKSKKEEPDKIHVTNIEKNVAALEKQVLELKSTISRLQSTSSQPFKSGPSGTGSDTSLLKKKVETLELRVMKLELDPWMTQRDQDTATGVQKAAESDKQLVELSPIHQTKPTICSVSDHLATPMEEESGNGGQNSTDDLVGLLTVLIFLVTVLIGLNL